MAKSKTLYLCFINMEDAGEMHLRRVKAHRAYGDYEIEYDDCSEEDAECYERVSDECIEKGYVDHDEFRYNMRHQERKGGEDDEYWNVLDATAGWTRTDALKAQKRRLQGKIRRAQARIEMCERMIEDVDSAIAGGHVWVYDEKMNRVEESALEQLAAEGE